MPRLACRGLEELCWQSEGIEPFIKEALELVRDLDAVLATLKDNVRRTQVGSAAGAWVAQRVLRLRRIDAPQRSLAYPCVGVAAAVSSSIHNCTRLARCEQEVLKAFERSLMFERKEGKVYTADELAEASTAVMAARHAEMREAGKEIGKLLSASNRAVKVSRARGWNG